MTGIVLTEAEREVLEYSAARIHADARNRRKALKMFSADILTARAMAIESLLARAGATEGSSDEQVR